MPLVYSVGCFAAAGLLFVLALLGNRNPNKPFWASEFWEGMVVCPAIVALFVIGLGLLGSFVWTLGTQPFSVIEIGLTLLIVAIFAVIFKLLRVRATLAQYAALTAGAAPLRARKAAKGRSGTRPNKARGKPSRPKGGKRAA
jgi:hypothetical protein